LLASQRRDHTVAKLDSVASLGNQAVMAPTDQYEIAEVRFAASTPMAYVVGIDKPRALTAREAAAAITCIQRPAKRRRDRAPLPTERQQAAVMLSHLDER